MRPRARERDVVGDLPLVALVVEQVGLGDVVGREHLGLHVEEVLGVADVGQELRRHLFFWA